MSFNLKSVADASELLEKNNYLPDDGIATAIFLAAQLQLPLFLEGEAGVGKTEVAKTLAKGFSAELIRLQCYEGIDISEAVYEWDYGRQLLHIRASEGLEGGRKNSEKNKANSDGESNTKDDAPKITSQLYSKDFLIERPLLRAISSKEPVVLLIDEIDRADDEFEAFLLELLSDWSITIPEIGTISAKTPPLVIITSNRTRDVHDALKRRCLYHWVAHPTLEKEVEILLLKSNVSENLASQIATKSSDFRQMGLYKPPGVAESIVWANALEKLGATELTEELMDASLGAVLKYSEDQEKVRQAS